MRPTTKLNPLPSTTFERLKASLSQIEELGSRIAPFAGLLTEMRAAVQLLEGPTRPTEAQLEAKHRALERAEDRLSRWPRKLRPSRRKTSFRLSEVTAAVLRDLRFAEAPMSAATLAEIQSRMPKAIKRGTLIKCIQRVRALDKCATPKLSNRRAL